MRVNWTRWRRRPGNTGAWYPLAWGSTTPAIGRPVGLLVTGAVSVEDPDGEATFLGVAGEVMAVERGRVLVFVVGAGPVPQWQD